MKELPWEDAMEYCMKQNSTLMLVEHPSDNAILSRYLKAIYKEENVVWMGLKQTGMCSSPLLCLYDHGLSL